MNVVLSWKSSLYFISFEWIRYFSLAIDDDIIVVSSRPIPRYAFKNDLNSEQRAIFDASYSFLYRFSVGPVNQILLPCMLYKYHHHVNVGFNHEMNDDIIDCKRCV